MSRVDSITIDMFQKTLGRLQEEARYVMIHDIDSGSWGYDVKTQAARARSDRSATLADSTGETGS